MFNTFNNTNNVNPLSSPQLFDFNGFLRVGVGDPRQAQLSVQASSSSCALATTSLQDIEGRFARPFFFDARQAAAYRVEFSATLFRAMP